MAKAENINPAILTWARETAGMSLDDAAARLGINANAVSSAAEKLDAMERGTKYPTRKQLTKFASVYRRPLIAFYMRQPPTRAPRGEDFRTLPFAVPPRDDARLDALLRDIRARQDMVKGLLDEDAARRDFVGSATMSRGVPFLVEAIATALEFMIDDPARRNGPASDLFKELRFRAEQLGVFVLLVGDLGSRHSAISERVFRGFAIADSLAPFVVINDQDSKAALSFTLIHELAHIWLGQTGVSGALIEGSTATPIGRIEQFCNDVAGKFLLPDIALATTPRFQAGNVEDAARSISKIARTWQVSEPMVAYRMNRLGLIGSGLFGSLSAAYAARWQATKEKTKDDARATEGGPSYYTVRQYKLGNALLGVVHDALRNGHLTQTKAAKVLGVNPGSVEPLLARYEKRRGAFSPAESG